MFRAEDSSKAFTALESSWNVNERIRPYLGLITMKYLVVYEHIQYIQDALELSQAQSSIHCFAALEI